MKIEDFVKEGDDIQKHIDRGISLEDIDKSITLLVGESLDALDKLVSNIASNEHAKSNYRASYEQVMQLHPTLYSHRKYGRQRQFGIGIWANAVYQHEERIQAFYGSIDPLVRNINIDMGRMGRPNFIEEEELERTAYILRTTMSILSSRSDYEGVEPLSDQEVRFVLPSEKPAPVRVEILNERLVPANSQHMAGKVDVESAEKIKAEITRQLQELLADLKDDSNIDKRYLRSFDSLLSALSKPAAESSIESIGVNAQLVERLTTALREELSNIQVAQIDHVIQATFDFINLFDEWRNYLEESRKEKPYSFDALEFVTNAQSVAEALEGSPEVVDPTIPRRLRDMIEPVLAGIVDAHSVIVPLSSSLSNILGRVSNFALDMSAQITSTTGYGLEDQKTLLLSFSLELIRRVFPIFSQYQPFKFAIAVLAWLKEKRK